MKAGAKGVVAAGHGWTARAMADVLRAGGNAFDAAVAGAFAACVVEPVLASLGGGGFLLARPEGAAPTVYDFFVQTPKARRSASEIDFRPVLADFGTTRQEFHVGLGAVATPGVIRGLVTIHRDLGALPLADVLAPAIAFARGGVELTGFQASVFRIVAPIFTATPEARAVYCRGGEASATARLLETGDVLVQAELSGTLELIAREGDAEFHEGPTGRALARLCGEGGGALGHEDLAGYRVERREPLTLDFRGWRLATNPPPSVGGLLVALGLDLLAASAPEPLPGSACAGWLDLVARVLHTTNIIRDQCTIDDVATALGRDPESDPLLARCRDAVRSRARCFRGTTHLDAIDGTGNVATLTLSNGEGSGHLWPGTGIMLNNMLGEDDLCPRGFHAWEEDRRMTSMMAPTIAVGPSGEIVATGSGGSKRIRSSILQVLANRIGHGMDVEAAVRAPRVTVEGERLIVEGGFAAEEVALLVEGWPEHEVWNEINLYFGGAHTVERSAGRLLGAGDPRRGGVCEIVGDPAG